MIRFHAMARATPRAAGLPVVFDLTRITHPAGTRPSFIDVVRDVETVKRSIRRKKFGVRPTLEISFQVPHSRARNARARWEEVSGNLLQMPDSPGSAPWTLSNASSAASPDVDPFGASTAVRITDATGAAIGVAIQNTGIPAAGRSGLLSVFARADAPRIASIGIQDNGANAADLDVQLDPAWQRFRIDLDFPVGALNFQAMLRPTQLTSSQTGSADFFRADLRRVQWKPGTDEEILEDLHAKLVDAEEEWDVEFSVNGGLTWRMLHLEEHERVPLADKWIGHFRRFSLSGDEMIPRSTPLLDGMW